MNVSVANLRRTASAVAAVALLSAPWTAHAQSEGTPVAPADTAAVPAPSTGETPKAKKTKAPEKPYAQRWAEDGIHAKGANWISLRLGYAKRVGDRVGQGLVGYGVGWQHMLNPRWAFAAGVGHDVVGHFQSHVDVAVPFTGEFQRHFGWKSSARPYLGLGGGYYFRKYYRTGTDYNTQTSGGMHVSVGIASRVGDHNALGIEARGARLKSKAGVTNPTFGTSEDSETLWTVKGTWSLVY